jgi:lipoprotein signal peptidase
MLDKAVLIADHISEQFQKLRDSYRLTQMQIGQFAGLNVYLSRFGSEVNGSIGMSISSGYEFNVDCHNPHSSLLHVVRNVIAANSIINWQAGLILATSMLIAHAIATYFLIKESPRSKLKLMFSHQNGMTAILLTIGLEVSGQGMGNLLSITLPAIILIAFFYLCSNYIIERRFTHIQKSC